MKLVMNLLRRLTDYLPLATLILLAVWPLFRYGPPSLIDGPLHFYRFVELDWHIRHGDFYPRWLADLHFGFGSPVFNYFPPLAYYVPVGMRFLGIPAPTAFLLAYVIPFALAMVGMYRWAQEQFHSYLAGLTAAAAYTLTPYFYFNVLGRGTLPETSALAVVAWLFWSVLRQIRSSSHRTRTTLLYVTLILTHNASALFFTPLLILYAISMLWNISADSRRAKVARLGQVTLSLAWGVGIAAIYWVPFLVEQSYAQFWRLGRFYDYHYFFLTLRELFSPPVPFDPHLVFQIIPISLPWPQLIIALMALVSYFWRPRHATQSRGTLAIPLNIVILASLAFLTLRISIPLWEATPIAGIIALPWRLIGPATFLLAWLAGAGIAHFPAPKLQVPATLVSITGIFFFSLTWTYHEPFQPFPASPTPIDSIRFEIANPDWIGTTSAGEFLPRWVRELPAPNTLLPRYEQSLIPSRLGDLPPDVTVLSQSFALNEADFEYVATQPFTLTLELFFFPGWAATVDNQPLPVEASSPNGLVALNLPAGRHAVRLNLQPTPPQLIGVTVSLLAGLMLLLRVFRRRSGTQGALNGIPASRPNSSHSATAPQILDEQTKSAPPTRVAPTLGLALLCMGLLALRVGLLDRVENPFWHTDFDKIPNVVSVNFDEQLELIGFKYPQGATFTSGGALNLTLYWRARQRLTTDYHTAVRLVDGRGPSFGQGGSFTPGPVPTSHWWPDKYSIDEVRLSTPAGIPPGDYHVLVSVYALADQNSTRSLAIRSGASPVGVEYDIGIVTVKRAAPQTAGTLRLVEGQLATGAATVGDRVTVNVLWNSGSAPLPPLSAHLALTDLDGRQLFALDLPPAGPDYPADQWTPNELVRYPLSFVLPPDLPAGPARLRISLQRPDQTRLTDEYDLGQLSISVPERSFREPQLTHRAEYDFGGAIRLLGYDLTPDTIVLYWQSLQIVPTPLTVFVHRFDASGVFIAGHDSPPPRPTSSWLPGEVISDMHPLAVGDYFEVGLYDPETGERFGQPFVVHP